MLISLNPKYKDLHKVSSRSDSCRLDHIAKIVKIIYVLICIHYLFVILAISERMCDAVLSDVSVWSPSKALFLFSKVAVRIAKHSLSYCSSLMSLSLTRGSTELLLWFIFLSSQGDSEALFSCTSKTQWVTIKAQWTPLG